jgi:magnesium chelatase subunit D
MNPEEGELRPQLLDRFGLCVEIKGINEAESRVRVIQLRHEYESSPEKFRKEWAPAEHQIRDRIIRARQSLPEVTISDEIMLMIAQICIDMAVDGHRADIVMMKTAMTIVAYNGGTDVGVEEVREAASLVLPHRMRRKPFSEQQMDHEKIEKSINKSQDERKQSQEKQEKSENDQAQQNTTPDGSTTTVFTEGLPFTLNQKKIASITRIDSQKRERSGKRSPTESRDGKYVSSRIPSKPSPDIAMDATIRAAAPFQIQRSGSLAIKIEPSDLREKVRERKTGNTILFVVDASGSMGVQKRMTAVKGAILSLLIDAYQKRDRVGLVIFRGNSAEILLPPTSSVELARVHLQNLPTGGKTPLAHGLAKGYEVLKHEIMINQDTIPRLILISDGKANVGMSTGSPLEDAKDIAGRIREAGISSLVIDSEQSYITFGLAQNLSEELGAKYVRLEDLQADQITDALKGICA